MASIPNEFIDQLLDRIDIVDVVNSRVSLKKAGKDFSGLCPFHAENTPSFTVSQQKQFYHCFGCGKNGSAIGFLMEYEGLDFVDAVKDLAQLAGMEVPITQGQGRHKTKTNLYAITEKTTRIYQQQLKNAPQVIDYLKNRRISGTTSHTFQLGYALNQWDGLMKRFDEAEYGMLDKTGLTTRNEQGRTYDKFRNRLMFPIHDKRGRVIAFGGRAIEAEQKPKYLNSPETELFHKSYELYGYHLARKHSQDDHILVVEGYMDVIALHEHGIKNSVATLGTATSAHHITSLFKVWDRIVFCFDGDSAGVQAAEKALKTALPLYLDNKIIDFLFLPQGEDPDSYVSDHGADAFRQLLGKALPLSEFLVQIMQRNINLQSIDGKAQFHEKAKPYIGQLPKGAFKKMMAAKIAEISGLTMQSNQPVTQNNEPSVSGSQNPLRKVISLLLNSPQLCEKIPNDMNLGILSFKGTEFIDKIIEIYRHNPQISAAAMSEHFRDTTYSPHLGRLRRLYDHLDERQKALEFDDIISHLVRLTSQVQIDQLRNKQMHAGLSSEEKQTLVHLLQQKTNQ